MKHTKNEYTSITKKKLDGSQQRSDQLNKY